MRHQMKSTRQRIPMLVLLMSLLTAIPNSQISWGSTWYVDGDAGAFSGRGKNSRDVLRSTEEVANIADLKNDDERWVRTKDQIEIHTASDMHARFGPVEGRIACSPATLITQPLSLRAFNISSYGIGKWPISNALGLAVNRGRTLYTFNYS